MHLIFYELSFELFLVHNWLKQCKHFIKILKLLNIKVKFYVNCHC